MWVLDPGLRQGGSSAEQLKTYIGNVLVLVVGPYRWNGTRYGFSSQDKSLLRFTLKSINGLSMWVLDAGLRQGGSGAGQLKTCIGNVLALVVSP